MFPIIVLLAELVLCVVVFVFFGVINGCGALLLIALTIVFFYYAAQNKQQASFVEEGTIEFVVAGKTLLHVLENVRGWHYHEGPGGTIKLQEATYTDLILPDGTRVHEGKIDSIRDNGDIPVTNAIVKNNDGIVLTKWEKWISERWPPKKYLQRRWGFFWVSILYPMRRIHHFTLRHKRKKPENDIATLQKDAPLTLWVEIDPLVEGGDQFLLWRFPRPIVVEGAEFKDLFEGDIFLQVQFQIIIPERPVFIYRSKEFFLLLESAVAAAVMDYVRGMSYTNFIQQIQTGAASPFFWKAINPLNRVAPGYPRGLISELGVQVIDAWIEHVALHKESEKTQDALKAKEQARLEGEAEVVTATLHANAVTIAATADAAALKMQMTQSSEAVLIAKLRKEGLLGTKISTLVEGGSSTGIMVSAPPAPTPPPPPPTPPTP